MGTELVQARAKKIEAELVQVPAKKMVARSKLIGNVRSIGDNSRAHTIVCDLPVSSGGTDMGPTALEIALVSLADCAVTIYADVAKRSKVELTSLEAVVEAEKLEGSPKIANVKLKIKAIGNDREKKLQAIWRRTEANCPVIRIFREPVPIETELELISLTEALEKVPESNWELKEYKAQVDEFFSQYRGAKLTVKVGSLLRIAERNLGYTEGLKKLIEYAEEKGWVKYPHGIY